LRGIPLKFSFKEAKELLSFGLPIIPAGIASLILSLSDRYFLKHYSTLAQVGLYSLGYRFGEFILFFAWAFQTAWPQFLFSNEKSPDAKTLYSKVTTYLLFVIVWVCLGVSMLAEEVIKIMAAPGFWEAYKVVPWIALSQVFLGLNLIGAVGINLKKKTGWLPLTYWIAAAVNLTLNYLFIPTYGMMGAAWATLAAYIIQFSLSFLISMKYYAIPYEYSRILKIAVIGLALYLVSCLVNFDSFVISAIFKIFLLLMYPLLLFVSGFFVQKELFYGQQFFAKAQNALRVH